MTDRAIDIAPRWAKRFPLWRAMLEQLDRGEPIELPRMPKPRPCGPEIIMAEIARRVGGSVIWVDPKE